jgi:hypothetical protein
MRAEGGVEMDEQVGNHEDHREPVPGCMFCDIILDSIDELEQAKREKPLDAAESGGG